MHMHVKGGISCSKAMAVSAWLIRTYIHLFILSIGADRYGQTV